MGQIRIQKRFAMIGIILALNFSSEVVHGILTHELGTDAYLPISVGEMVRGPILFALIIYAIIYARRFSSRLVLAGLVGLVSLIGIQALLFNFSTAEIIETILRGLRWIFFFFVINFIFGELSRHPVKPQNVVTLLKWMVVIFYCIPILLSAAGIAGYTVYGEDSGRMGYAGFIMNSNVVASVFVVLLPFYLSVEKTMDYILLAIYLLSSLLLGSKLVYIGIAAEIGGFILWKSILWFASKRASIRKSIMTALGLFSLLAVGAVFSPFMDKISSIFTGLYNLFAWYMSPSSGYSSTFVDVLTSHRTDRLYQFLDWVKLPSNFLPAMIGGGSPNYAHLYAEVDWIDLISLFGILGMFVFYGTLVILLIKVIRSDQTEYRLETAFMLLISISVSISSGHTYDGPVIGIIYGILIGLFFSRAYAVNKNLILHPSKRTNPLIPDSNLKITFKSSESTDG